MRAIPLLIVAVGIPSLAAPVPKPEPKPGEERSFEIADGLRMTFCWVPAGECRLGSPKAELDHVAKTFFDGRRQDWFDGNAEAARGTFVNRAGFWLGKYEVTQAEYEAVAGSNPSHFCKTGMGKESVAGVDTSRFPVECVTHAECAGFLAAINRRGGFAKAFGREGTFVLPHEDRWEYACRGGNGNGRAFYWGDAFDGSQANGDGRDPYSGSAGGKLRDRPAPVGSYATAAPHPWGLCDMTGNVAERCANPFARDPEGRAIRGGGWSCNAWACRTAHRRQSMPDGFGYTTGFRVCVESK